MCGALRLINLVHNGIIANNRIIKVNDFIVNTMGSGAKICIILGCQAVVGNPGYRIGAPVDISKVKSAGLQKRSVNTTNGKSEQPMKKQKAKSTPKEEKKKPAPLSIVGLKYAQASAVVGEKVTLVREPDNVSSLTWDNSTTSYCAIYLSHEYCMYLLSQNLQKYDPNAVKVVNKFNQQVGHIKKEHAAGLAKSWDNSTTELVAEGTIVNAGNGWEQSVDVTFRAANTGGVIDTIAK